VNKISEQNSKDTILDEIHSVQKRYSSERKGLNWSEEKELIDKKVIEFSKKYNIKFKIITPDEILTSAK